MTYFFEIFEKTIDRIFQPIIKRALKKESRNIENRRQQQALTETAHFVEQNFPLLQSFENRFALLTYAVGQIKAPQNGLVCELGVWQGETLNFIAKLLPRFTIYGFDSFEGLPEDWRDVYPRGAFAVKKKPKTLHNVILVEGLFQNTLPEFLQKHTGSARFLHIDCDLYSSTQTVLKEFSPRIQAGTIIVFDEFFNYPGWQLGEYRAFTEFIEQYSLTFEYIGYCRYDKQVAVKITG